MRRRLFPLFAAIALTALTLTMMSGAAVAQTDDAGQGPLDPAPPKNISVDQIVQRFAAKESEFKQARDSYTYRQTVKIQTVDGNTVDGEYQQVSDILFDAQGRRTENVVFAPMSTLKSVSMTAQDEEDIRKTMPFVLTSEEVPEYNIRYAGQQRVDELDTYVFDVSPRRMEKDRRYFEGRIWVDQQDLQIVMTHGKPVPDIRSKNNENLFPKFTTYREQVDGRYWFPTYTRADDFLQFKSGPVHIRTVIKYTDYKRFGANTKIIYDGQEVQKGQEQQQSPPK